MTREAVRVDLLGPLRVLAGKRRVEIAAPKQRTLLAVLALRAGAVVSATELIAALWGDRPPASAHKTVQAYVSRLRDALGEAAILTQFPGYALAADREQVDAFVFESAVDGARRALRDGDPARAVTLFDGALGLWRSDPLVDLGDTELARAQIARLQELRLGAVEGRVAARLAICDPSELVPVLEALVTEHPFRERLWCCLMIALYRSGRQRDALGAYQRARRVLVDELGIEPGPYLRELESAVLSQAPELAAGAVGAAGMPVLARVERVETAVPAPGANLPAAATSFVGRGPNLRTLAELVATPGIVTLTGPGGVGKTRLALEGAATVAGSWPDGTRLVELAPVTNGQAVPEAVAHGLKVRVPPEVSALDAVVQALSSRRLLVVLDNCEHVVDEVREVLVHVLRACPLVTALATSREPLSVASERVWSVPPLPVPDRDEVDLDALRSNPSVTLFLDRAQAAAPGFHLTDDNAAAVGEVCRRLDGLPLALELAAVQMRFMGPADLARRLDERFRLLRRGPRNVAPRHQALQAAIDWSYHLLEERERLLFDRLSVFVGGFDLDAAEAVGAGPGLNPVEVSDVLAGLVERSMVAARIAADGTARYVLLDTLRQYGAERLAARGETAAVQRRHAEHFADVARHAGAGVRGPEEARWVGGVEAAFDDMRAAHAWAVHQGEAGLALAIAADLLPFDGRNRAEVLSWAEVAIDMPGAEALERYPDACAAAARKAGLRGDLARAEALGRRSIELAQARGARPLSEALYAAALRSFVEGDEDGIAQHLRRRDLALSVGDDVAAASGQAYAALLTHYRGNTDAAIDLADEARRLADRTGNPSTKAGILYVHGEILQDVEPSRATAHLEDALALARSVHNDFTVDIVLVSLASLHARHGDTERALELFLEVVANWRRQGAWRQQWVTLRNVAELLGLLELDAQAAVLLGAIDAAATAPAAFGTQAARLAGLRGHLEERLGTDGFRRATDHGAAMTDDEAVDFARDVIEYALAGGDRPQ